MFEYLKKVDELGGAVKAIELGYFQNEIGNSAYQYQQDIEQGERIVIGQNKFIDDQEIQPEILKLEVTAALEQLKELKFVKDARDGDALEKSLSNLKAAAQNTETNLYPFILSAVREYASIGEISNTLRSVFGEYQGQ
mgnify:FL=1